MSLPVFSRSLALLWVVLCLPLALPAQEDDESKYLAGAVPEVDGEVVFSHTYLLSGKTRQELFDCMADWMAKRMERNANTSRLVYANPEKGQVVGRAEEWIVFHSSALALDRTLMHYQLTAYCQPGKCELQFSRISFDYEDEDHYKAEEWITDRYALNKSRTRLVRGLAKWRKRTVDFADSLFAEAGRVLGVSEAGVSLQYGRSAFVADASAGELREVTPADLPADALKAGTGTIVVTIGSDPFNMSTMTANVGGSLGVKDGKRVVFVLFSPDQPSQAMEQVLEYGVRFYPVGQNEPSVVLQCRKLPVQAMPDGFPRLYAGEVLTAFVR